MHNNFAEHNAYHADMQSAYPAGIMEVKDDGDGRANQPTKAKAKKPESPRRKRRREKLAYVIEKFGGVTAVGLEIGTPKTHLSALLNPDSDKGVGDQLAAKIERKYNLGEGWFDAENVFEAIGIIPIESRKHTPNVTELDPQRIRVPLISWIQAGEFSDVVDLFHPGEAVQWEDAFKSRPGRHGYALLVEGDSMVSQTGVHSFPPGTVLIVDPERAANAGDFVIAKDVQTQKATFKQLTTDGARWYLKPLNTQYPTIEIDDPALRVIGRVIEAKPPSVKL